MATSANSSLAYDSSRSRWRVSFNFSVEIHDGLTQARNNDSTEAQRQIASPPTHCEAPVLNEAEVPQPDESPSSEERVPSLKPEPQSVEQVEANVAEEVEDEPMLAYEDEMPELKRTTTGDVIERWLHELENDEELARIKLNNHKEAGEDDDDDDDEILMDGEKWDLAVEVEADGEVYFRHPKTTVMKAGADGTTYFRFAKPTGVKGEPICEDIAPTPERCDSPGPASYWDPLADPIDDAENEKKE